MSNVYPANFSAAADRTLRKPPGPPDNGGVMEARVAALEASMSNIERDVAVMRAEMKSFASKEDLYKAINDQTWKLITWTTGLGVALVGAAFLVARYVH